MLRLLDLFCGAGGAGMGYHRAGFEVVGVDSKPQKHYPFEFHCADAFAFLEKHGHEFDVIHASPPCQAYSVATRDKSKHPDLVPRMQQVLRALGKPYIIENVPGAPLDRPFMLCGSMFDGLRVYRHRLFESSVDYLCTVTPTHGPHVHRVVEMGRSAKAGEWMTVVGHVSNVPEARKAMGIDWMTQKEISQAIPPAYTEWIGTQLLDLR